MKHTYLSCLGIFCLLFSTGCHREQLVPKDEPVVAFGTNPNLNSTVGKDVQPFKEIKDGGSDRDRLDFGFAWSDFDPTGFYLAPNASMVVNVEQLTGSAKPKILIGTYSRYTVKNNPQSFTLKEGANTITADEFGGLVWVRFVTSGTPTSSVLIRFMSGHQRAPVYIKDLTNNEDWQKQLDTYTAAPDVILIGERVYQVYSRERALKTRNQDNNYTLDKADQTIDVENAISGMDGSAPQHEPSPNKILMTEYDGDTYMFATAYRTAYSTGGAQYAFTPQLSKEWGPWHELGHMHQQQSWKWNGLGEVTVNIYSLAVQRAMGITPSRLKSGNYWPTVASFLALAETDTAKNFNSSNIKDPLWVRLYMFHQLWMAYGDDFYIKLHQLTRTENPVVKTDEDKMRYFMLKACSISQHDLTTFFRKWGFRVNENIYKEITALNLSKPTIEPSTLNEETPFVSGATYKIVSVLNNSSVLDVTGNGSSNGTLVDLWSNNNPSSNNQLWKITSVGSGYYKIQPLNATGKVLDASGGAPTNGTRLQIYTDNGSAEQKWLIVNVGNGNYTFSPASAPTYKLNINQANASNGTAVNIWITGNVKEQKFKLVKQ